MVGRSGDGGILTHCACWSFSFKSLRKVSQRDFDRKNLVSLVLVGIVLPADLPGTSVEEAGAGIGSVVFFSKSRSCSFGAFARSGCSDASRQGYESGALRVACHCPTIMAAKQRAASAGGRARATQSATGNRQSLSVVRAHSLYRAMIQRDDR